MVSLLAIAALSMGAQPAIAACDDVLPEQGMAAAQERRDITPADLVRLRDIGFPDVVSGKVSPFAFSPDGRLIAFVVTRAEPTDNTICSALVVAPLDGKSVEGKGRARVLDIGGALPFSRGVYRGLFIKSGISALITPAWSPDGKSIAYLKNVGGVVQVYRVNVDGSGGGAATRAETDIEDFSWSPDGSQVTYLARPGELESSRRTEEAGRSGWLYDSSVLPNESLDPRAWVEDIPLKAFTVDLATGAARAATEDERLRVVPAPPTGTFYELGTHSADGAEALTKRLNANPNADQRLWVRLAGNREKACARAECTGRIVQAWWDAAGNSLVFLRRQGWNREEWALYRWAPGSDKLSLIVRTFDALTGCIRAGEQLVCGRENSITPRRVVAIDLASGRSRTIFDPNPEFNQFRLGKVRRLRWTNDRGLEAWGDLVLPPGYDGKSRLPLVITQYHSQGFLRGGTGDDYPVFPLAAKGFAVLSFERPPNVSSITPGVSDWDEALTVQFKGWAERRSLFSSVDRGIDTAIATGFVDPGRIGITGLSDGASTIEFALVNSRRFAAAAMSTCCDDMLSSMVLGGFAWGEHNIKIGLPPSVDNDRDYWRPVSLSVNARKIDTPILMQLADRETLLALPAFGALREAGKPAEMFVYPDEYHDKWQPAHRLAVYQRGIDWFDYWLRGTRDPDPAKQDQYARWDRLRDLRDKAKVANLP
ncbi:Atxe2 family lasso peptide isopeptidase (plasmid) [Novosphingobium sp. BL-8A]|uniref:Atxe2 family lasso peptide isopeptidase n=1 Tax=Novosphingobium sp. BL-8A TaxID=3127639 RepID=UPI00375824AF